MSRLVSDPSRQAHDTLRGYIYQVLRSIAVWLDLGDNEQLFLEGAEDLDRIDAGQALTEQVKDTAGSGNVTLRTASVVEAINNFWRRAPHRFQRVARPRLAGASLGLDADARSCCATTRASRAEADRG